MRISLHIFSIFVLRAEIVRSAPIVRQNVRYVRNFKNFNATDFLINDLSQMPWENVVQYENPNSCWQLWKSFYLQILDRHAPFRCMRIRGNSLPWITPNIKNLMKVRDFHKKKAVKFNSQLLYTGRSIKTLSIKLTLNCTKPKFPTFADCAQTKDHLWVRILNQTTFPK